MGRFTDGRAGQAATGSTGRSLAGGIRPGRWTFAASTASATAPAKPSFQWLRTRSRPRCSRLLMADPPAAWARRAQRNASPLSRTRSAFDSLPFRGMASAPASRQAPAGPGAVRTAVEAHHRQVGEPGPRLPAHGDRHVHVAPLPNDGMVREESVTVLRDADRNAGLHRDPGLSLRYPAGVRPQPPAGPGHVPDHAPRRVHRQAAVGRMMHVGPGHEGMTAAARRGARLFSGHPVAPLHDHPSDPGGKFRRGERHAVNQTPVSVSVHVP